jgi:hypothetical protein
LCLIIYSPKGHVPAKTDIASALKQNPDGVGLMHFTNQPVVYRTMQTTAQAVYNRMETLRDFDKVIHFRMATHGTVTGSNLHPFRMVDGSFLMHNGILHINRDDKARSDTWHFVEKVLNPLAKDKQLDWAKIGDVIGPSNKFSVLDPKGHVTLVNEATGVWHDDAWYSNTYAWDNDYSMSWSREWDDEDTSDSLDLLSYAVIDGISDALIDRSFVHEDFDADWMTANEIYHALEKLTPMELADLTDCYFKYQRRFNTL